jgi:hypothetical protein
MEMNSERRRRANSGGNVKFPLRAGMTGEKAPPIPLAVALDDISWSADVSFLYVERGGT